MKRVLLKLIKKISRVAIQSDLSNIKSELKRIATHQTALYVTEHMANISSVESRNAVHDVGLSHIKPNGLVLEFGVFSARTINYIARKLPNRTVHGFDSFEGLPEFWRDGFEKGMFAVKMLPSVQTNVELHKGWFNETIPAFLKTTVSNQEIAYLHIDCDLYSSTKTIFENLGDLIVPGTIIVFDEYFNYPGWLEGEFLAFKEFVKSSKLKYEYLTYTYNKEQVAVKILSDY